MRLSSLVLCVVLCIVGCDNRAMPMGDGGLGADGGVHVVFDPPTSGPIDFADVPFPDDLYVSGGHVQLGAFPGEADARPEMVATERTALADLDGFGTSTPVFFRIDGDLDPTTLPAMPSASLQADASVFMVDAESASPTAGQRVPIELSWDPTERLLAVRPWAGHALHEGRAYAVVVTTNVHAADGSPLMPTPRFAAIRDASSRPSDPIDAAAWNEYSPVLASAGVMRSQVAGMALFHVQTVSRDLEDARTILRASHPDLTILRVASGADLDALLGTPAMDVPGTDVMGGVQHTHIGTLIDGTFASPNFVSDQPFVHGPWTRDASGTLQVRRMDTVWFTVALPPGDVSNVPVVVYQHGLGDDRSAIFGVADALCAQGFAVAAIDIPFHGMRAFGMNIDTAHNFGATTGPDLYGDVTGTSVYVSFVGVVDTMGPYVDFHPSYPRDTLRQSVVDVMALVNALDTSDWSAVASMGGPMALGFSDAPIGFVGVSLGGIVGTTFVTAEPRVGAAVLNVTGGELTNLVAFSSSFNSTFLPILLPSIGVNPDTLDYTHLPPRFLPQVALYQTLLDRGDSMSFAPVLASQPKHVLFQMAFDDETVPNQATEALARSASAVIVGGSPRYSDLEMVTGPVVSNLVLGSMRVTRGLSVFDPATHGLLSQRSAQATVVHPPLPPFMPLAHPTPVMNPVDGAIAQMVHFFVTFRGGAAEISP